MNTAGLRIKYSWSVVEKCIMISKSCTYKLREIWDCTVKVLTKFFYCGIALIIATLVSFIAKLLLDP